MKAIMKVNKQPGFVYKETPMPKVGHDDVLIRIRAAAICGSDMNFYQWNAAFCDMLVDSLPFIPGHECSGTVEAVGEAVKHFKKGDMVSVDTHIPCGGCRQCRIGRPHTCLHMKLFGHNMNGCFAEYASVPQAGVKKISNKLTFLQGALLEPLGVAIRPVLDADASMASVLITGCGPIGQCAIACVSAVGAYRIDAADINPDRLELAKIMGADHVIDVNKTPNFSKQLVEQSEGGFDLAIEASGDTQALNECLCSLRYGGTLVMIGQPKKAWTIEDPMRSITLKEVTIKGTWGRELFATWEHAERLMLRKKIDCDALVTHQFSLDEHEEAFKVAQSGQGCKVMFIIP